MMTEGSSSGRCQTSWVGEGAVGTVRGQERLPTVQSRGAASIASCGRAAPRSLGAPQAVLSSLQLLPPASSEGTWLVLLCLCCTEEETEAQRGQGTLGGPGAGRQRGGAPGHWHAGRVRGTVAEGSMPLRSARLEKQAGGWETGAGAGICASEPGLCPILAA